jgi:hypothetical protein
MSSKENFQENYNIQWTKKDIGDARMMTVSYLWLEAENELVAR